MPLEFPPDRRLATANQLTALARAVYEAPPATPETDAVEWKGPLDLGARYAQFDIGRHILGFGNRTVAQASRAFEGYAYLLAGVEPGTVHGVSVMDPARLTDAFGRYVASGQPFWDPHYVTVNDADVLVIEVRAPMSGDRICVLQHGFENALPGRIFARRQGQTLEANVHEVHALEERLLAGTAEARDRRDRERYQMERETRARERQPIFGASQHGDFAFTPPGTISGFLHNDGESAALVRHVRLHHGHGAVPGSVVAVYASGVTNDPGPEARIESGVHVLFNFRNPALGHLEGSSEAMTLEFAYIDDTDFLWDCKATLRRDGTTVNDRTRWTVREVRPKLAGPSSE
ncbi:MAG TPA: hypothetical protein VGF21_01940 [Thermoleophilaceae bacterium]